MKRIPIIAGNWKMHKTAEETREFVSKLCEEDFLKERKVFLAIPYTSLECAVEIAQKKGIFIGAQNMHDREEGAFTGEISARMLQSIGVEFVLLGHSERRQYFKETNAFIHAKLKRALQEKLIPILCVGEVLEEREREEWKKVLHSQLESCLAEISSSEASQIIIAYEPVWAIGTGKTATPEEAQEVHFFIREWFSMRFGSHCAENVSLLYGGSVKPSNIASLMKQKDIDGVLVGGASLEVQSFIQMINY